MSLPEQIQKIKGFLNFHEGPLGTILHVLLLSGVGFGGYFIGVESLKGGEEERIAVFSPTVVAIPSPTPLSSFSIADETGKSVGDGEGAFVASGKGTKYHRIDCPGAQSIKEENRVYFASEDEAEKAGYGPAGNCPGLR